MMTEIAEDASAPQSAAPTAFDLKAHRRYLLSLARMQLGDKSLASLGDQNGTLLDILSDPDRLCAFVRANVIPVGHHAGTCKMGSRSDSMAVVDSAGKVFGLDGLRVADASVMPTIPRGNTNLPTLMIAEKMAEAILMGSTRAVPEISLYSAS